MREDEIAAAVERARKGVAQYLEIMALLPAVDVSADRDFQRRFNGFYRVRQRPPEWYAAYYAFMERRKANPPRFEEVLDHLHATLGRYEPSFSSKLAATLDPSEPVWDKYVVRHTGQKAPCYSSPRRWEMAKAVFQGIRDWYRERLESPEGRLMIEVFDEIIAEHERITDIKKIDFVLWQTRGQPMGRLEGARLPSASAGGG